MEEIGGNLRRVACHALPVSATGGLAHADSKARTQGGCLATSLLAQRRQGCQGSLELGRRLVNRVPACSELGRAAQRRTALPTDPDRQGLLDRPRLKDNVGKGVVGA